MTDVTVVVGGQYGSEGKGAIAGYICSEYDHADLAIRVAGPNAGHTVIDKNTDREWKLRQVPVAAVSSSDCVLYIAAGSEIDPSVLYHEIVELDVAGRNVSGRLLIHPSATVIRPENQAEEAALVSRIGSTGKGIGSARAERIMRTALTFEEWAGMAGQDRPWAKRLIRQVDPVNDGYNKVLVEGTQGYGLGLHTRFYPQVTSSDCRAIDFLAMAGISPWRENVRVETVVVCRMYPIRVAGNSGPMLGETTWAELGLPEERTTVTNNIRRVGHWDLDLVKAALKANGASSWGSNVCVALTMLDQRFPKCAGMLDLDDEQEAFVDELEDELMTYISFVGTGPRTVVER